MFSKYFFLLCVVYSSRLPHIFITNQFNFHTSFFISSQPFTNVSHLHLVHCNIYRNEIYEKFLSVGLSLTFSTLLISPILYAKSSFEFRKTLAQIKLHSCIVILNIVPRKECTEQYEIFTRASHTLRKEVHTKKSRVV